MALIRTCTNKSCVYSQGNAVVTERFMSVALIVCFELHWLQWLYNAPAFRTINNHASARTVSHQNLTIEAWVQSLASTCNICGQSGNGIGFLYALEVNLRSNIPSMFHTHLFSYLYSHIISATNSTIKQHT